MPAAINAAQRQFQQRRVAGRNAALDRIAALYRIEAEIRDLTAAERHAPCQARDAAVATALRARVRGAARKAVRPPPIAKAIGQALNHWDSLVRFLDGGCIEIDSNTVEPR